FQEAERDSWLGKHSEVPSANCEFGLGTSHRENQGLVFGVLPRSKMWIRNRGYRCLRNSS
ncbi:hypothetical protein CHARACLAT_032725, partial [Characodon lateralis]|nr:hypothetical protein [Characodon lateralis]